VAQVLERQFVIIGGDSTIVNKGELARHLAWQLRNQIASGVNGHHISLLVKEWFGESSLQDLSRALQNEPKPTIVILTGLEPQHIQYDPFKIKKMAINSQHYVIATSEVSEEKWKLLPRENEQFWWEIRQTDYEQEYLTAHLRKSLKDNQDKLPDAFRFQDWNQSQYLVNNFSLDQIASRLETPVNILYFVTYICRDQICDSDGIQRLINQMQHQDHQANLRGWYFSRPGQEVAHNVELASRPSAIAFTAWSDHLASFTARPR